MYVHGPAAVTEVFASTEASIEIDESGAPEPAASGAPPPPLPLLRPQAIRHRSNQRIYRSDGAASATVASTPTPASSRPGGGGVDVWIVSSSSSSGGSE